MVKFKRWLVFSMIALFTLSLLLSGCGAKKTEGTATSGSADAGTKTINIGWTGPLSGGAALYGQNTVEGIKLAIKEINAAGGVTVGGQKYNFNLVTLDDQYLPNNSATNARRLKTENKCAVIFVPHSGGVFALQEFNQTDNFLIAAYTSEPKIVERGNKLTFRIPPAYNFYIEPFSKAVMEKYGKKVALIPGTHQYAKDWTALFKPAWEKLGGTITGDFAVDYNKETDFYTYVSKALATKPDVLFVGGASKPTAMVIKQARQLGFKGGFILMDQAKLEEMEQTLPLADLTGGVGVMPVSQSPDPGVPKFVSSFKAEYNGKLPTSEMGLNYSGMKIVAKGIEKSGSIDDPVKIFKGMQDAMPMKGGVLPYEINSLSPNGALSYEVKGVMIVDGKYGSAIPIPQQ